MTEFAVLSSCRKHYLMSRQINECDKFCRILSDLIGCSTWNKIDWFALKEKHFDEKCQTMLPFWLQLLSSSLGSQTLRFRAKLRMSDQFGPRASAWTCWVWHFLGRCPIDPETIINTHCVIIELASILSSTFHVSMLLIVLKLNPKRVKP